MNMPGRRAATITTSLNFLRRTSLNTIRSLPLYSEIQSLRHAPNLLSRLFCCNDTSSGRDSPVSTSRIGFGPRSISRIPPPEEKKGGFGEVLQWEGRAAERIGVALPAPVNPSVPFSLDLALRAHMLVANSAVTTSLSTDAGSALPIVIMLLRSDIECRCWVHASRNAWKSRIDRPRPSDLAAGWRLLRMSNLQPA